MKAPIVLSIDWDYFIKATAEERSDLFPDGGNEKLSALVQSVIWVSNYATSHIQCELRGSKKIQDIGIHENELLKLIDLIACNVKHSTTFQVAESHSDIVSQLSKGCSVVNIDYHHDCFTASELLDCGNWARLKIKDGTIAKLVWVSHEDSDTNCEVICDKREGVGNISFPNGIDHIFMCRSGMWSPPHLDAKFISTVLMIDDCMGTKSGADGLCKMVNRWNTSIEQDIASMIEQTKLFYTSMTE